MHKTRKTVLYDRVILIRLNPLFRKVSWQFTIKFSHH